MTPHQRTRSTTGGSMTAPRGAPKGGTRKKWTEADTEALLELAPTCTWAQIAEYLGRHPVLIRPKALQLKRAGVEFNDRRRSRLPWHVPAGAVLLAKTCPGCGRLKAAKQFQAVKHRKGWHGWSPTCRMCRGAKRKDWLTENQKTYGPYLSQENNDELLQEITFAQASRRYDRYTSREIETLSDATKSDFELALELGRTFYAVRTIRSRLGIVQPKSQLDDGSHWLIHFPNALKALQEHFAELGTPIPEEFWEWNDEEVA